MHDLCVIKVVERENVLLTHSKNPSVKYFESTLQWCFDKLPKLITEQSITNKSKFEDWKQKLKRTLNPDLATTLETKIIEFSGWNCDTDAYFYIPKPAEIDYDQVVGITAIYYVDGFNSKSNLNYVGAVAYGNTQISLYREDGGVLDSPTYANTKGFIKIDYIP